MDISKVKRFFCNALFCVIVVFLFGTITVLRLPATGAAYKEFLSGVIVLCLFYVNRYGLYFRYYLKGMFRQYLLLSSTSALIATVTEFILIYPQIAVTLSATSTSNEARLSCFIYFFLILCRNCTVILISSFYCSHIHLRHLNELYECRLREKTGEILAIDRDKPIQITIDNVPSQTNTAHRDPIDAEDRRLESADHQLFNAMTFFLVKDILYFKQIKSTSFLHTADDKILIHNSTIAKTVSALGIGNFVRISKDTIVNKAYVCSYDERNVHLLNPVTKKEIRLEWSSGYKKDALPVLEQLLKRAEHTSPILQDLSDEIQKWNIPLLLQQEKVSKVYFYIHNHPLCKASDMSAELQLTTATANRILKQLKDEGLIKHEGSKKTGGYSVVSS